MNKKSELIPVRLSHLLRHCSVGAIVRGPEYLMTVKDIREWSDRKGNPAGEPIRYVDQVRSALGITQELREPPIARELSNGQIDGTCVPAVRFPSWMRCPKCGLLHYRPWKGLPPDKKPICHENDPKKCSTRPELEQVPWILVHKDGHMADVPWHFLAHPEEGKGTQVQKQCGRDFDAPYLRLRDQGASRRRLRCERCGAEKDFDDSTRIPFGKAWQQPWLKEQVVAEELAEVLEINDARVHSPVTCNALVIPPESRIRKGSVVDRLHRNSQKLRQIEQARTPLAKKGALQAIASEFRCPVVSIEEALCEIAKGYPSYGKKVTPGLLLESEYQAFLDELPDMADDEDFVARHHTREWKSKSDQFPQGSRPHRVIAAVSYLVAVNRLKEIMVLKGFARLGGVPVPPDIEGKSDWLPALELYGEGVFFALDEELLSRWELDDALESRAKDFKRRYAIFHQPRACPGDEAIVTPRFLLLHTLAHLLIRQLESQAGYPAASLKERIYCTAGKLPMAGILVYVAVPDIVGSLGGLAELATPDRFLPLLASVFDHSEWCSLDPVCSEHGGQGPSLLNRAACHACALIPEPSCAYGNVLLDRTFIKGDVATGMPAFLVTANNPKL
jgi:hypothetical protein